MKRIRRGWSVARCPPTKCRLSGCSAKRQLRNKFCEHHKRGLLHTTMCLYGCGLYLTEYSIRDHDCRKIQCDVCGFYFLPTKMKGHRCRNEQCDICKIWYVSLKRHRCRQHTCSVCFDKFTNLEKHVEKKHPQKKEIAETGLFPDDITNIVSRLCGYEKLYLYCGICLKRATPSDDHRRPFQHTQTCLYLTLSDRDKLKSLRG